MKKLLFLFLIISGTLIQAQTNSVKINLDGKYGFIYNDQEHIVHFIASSNTFIEYDKEGHQLTDGEFIKKNDIYYLTPIVKSNKSEIKLPINFKVMKSLPKKLIVVFNSEQVESKTLNLYKL
jgi:hypothetical protein